MSTTDLVKRDNVEVVPALTPAQKSLIFSHYLHHRAPQVVFRRIFPDNPPCTLSAFVRLYTDSVVEFLTPLAQHGAAALTPALQASLAALESARDGLLKALNAELQPSPKERASLAHALAATVGRIIEIHKQQIGDATALHSLLMSNAGADDGAD